MGSARSQSPRIVKRDRAAHPQDQPTLIQAGSSAPERLDRRSILLAIASLFASSSVASTGCAVWKKEPEDKTDQSPSLRNHRMANDSVVVEIAVVDLSSDPSMVQAIWMQIDETGVDPKVRQQLWNNGFRVGVAPSALPPELAQQLEQQMRLADVDPQTGAMAPGVRLNQQRHQLRSGQALQISTAPLQESLAWIVDDEGYRMGGTAEQAECQFALRTYPRQEGTVRIKATPEIHHGTARQSVDVTDASMIFRAHRDRQTFTNLEMSLDLQPGQTMVIGTTPVGAQLGHLFLSQPSAVQEFRNRAVLIRVGQVQLDDLFQNDARFRPLETPVE